MLTNEIKDNLKITTYKSYKLSLIGCILTFLIFTAFRFFVGDFIEEIYGDKTRLIHDSQDIVRIIYENQLHTILHDNPVSKLFITLFGLSARSNYSSDNLLNSLFFSLIFLIISFSFIFLITLSFQLIYLISKIVFKQRLSLSTFKNIWVYIIFVFGLTLIITVSSNYIYEAFGGTGCGCIIGTKATATELVVH